ncbi:TetR/AcrR family transcriptional regulator [Zhouia sp. PK063]|uniref:TetR/AcrR family transcriptional regulator n=1 Tax=Zhouia sp. PK063 TaxID=3373602 RepID=UPI0037B349D9
MNKCKIIEKSTQMFLDLGFKSVTMDDIANESGMSKKTIYQYFKNKKELVSACVNDLIDFIQNGICCVKKEELNAIEEHMEVRKFVIRSLKNEKSSPQHQLEKYYPGIFKDARTRHFSLMTDSVKENIEKGMKEGLYRGDLDPDIVSKIYFLATVELKNQNVFPQENYDLFHLMDILSEYHLRALLTPKGVLEFEKLNKNQ